jgi:glycogen operon protein
MHLAGDLINDTDERNNKVFGDTFLLLLNAHWEQLEFVLPATMTQWQVVIDTVASVAQRKFFPAKHRYLLEGRSLALLRGSGHRTTAVAEESHS